MHSPTDEHPVQRLFGLLARIIPEVVESVTVGAWSSGE